MEVLAGPLDWLFCGFSEKTCEECFHPLDEYGCPRCGTIVELREEAVRESSMTTWPRSIGHVTYTADSSGKAPPELPARSTRPEPTRIPSQGVPTWKVQDGYYRIVPVGPKIVPG